MQLPEKPQTLTQKSYSQAISELTRRDNGLAKIIELWGEPSFWVHSPGFAGLVLAILSQQVSLESAQAVFLRLGQRLGSIRPEPFLGLDDATLRELGFSRQKASYVRGLARMVLTGDLDLAELESLQDEPARERLLSIRGVGPWTADTYLLFALRRPNAWPSGDLALAKAIQKIENADALPGWDVIDEIADRWRPWRAVAARILWHDYLCERGRAI
jgi:DNA-3-methyladenine glycosylase II